jgi:hypothetical protein
MGWASGMAAGVRLGEAVNAARAKKKEGLVAEEISAFDAAQAEQAAAFKKQQESEKTTASIQAAFNNGGIGAGPSQNMSAVPQAPNTLAGMGLATQPTDTAPQQSPMPAPTRVEAPMSALDQMRRKESIYRGAGLTDQADRLSQQIIQTSQFEDQLSQQQSQFQAGLEQRDNEFEVRANEFRAQLDATINNNQNTQANDAERNRIQSDLATANINSMNFQLDKFKNDSASADAVAFGESEYQRVISSGGSLESLLESIDRQYAKTPKQLVAARTAATGKFYADNGFNAQTAGYIAQEARKPIENFLARDFGGDEAQTIGAFNSSLAEMFDPDLADGKPTTLRVVQDKDGNAVGYAIANGDTADDILESFSSLAEVRGRAKQELAAIQDNPFYLVGVIQKKKESAAYKISQAKTSAEKEKLFGDFLKDNPQYASEGMAPQLLRIRGEFGLDGLAGWGGGNTPLVMGRQPNGLVYDPQAEMAKLNATRAEQEETAARLKSQAQGLLDDPNIDVNALLSSTDVPQGLRAALSDNAAAVAKAAATRGRTARF